MAPPATRQANPNDLAARDGTEVQADRFLEELPITATGKKLYYRLREQAKRPRTPACCRRRDPASRPADVAALARSANATAAPSRSAVGGWVARRPATHRGGSRSARF